MGLLDKVKGAIKNMFGTSDIETALNVDIAISAKMESAIKIWQAVYENRAPWLNESVKSTELASSIASEFSRLILAEMKTEITGSKRADFLQEQYKVFLNSMKDNLELGNATGGMIFKPYVKGNRIYVDLIKQGAFYPVAFDDTGKITSAIFSSQKVQGDYIYTRLEYHRLDGTDYYITNTVYKSRDKNALGKQINLTDVPEWQDIEPETKIENLEKSLFSYYKPPAANNVDTKSPLGISVFARAINLIQDVDEQYGRVLWEYEGSEKAVYASVEALKPRKETIRDGEQRRTKWTTPKLKERLFRAIDIDKKDGEGFFQDYSPEIRDEAFWRGLNKILERIEFTLGFAYGTLSEPSFSDKTATEIKISKQRSYVTISRAQNNLQIALEDLVYAMDALATLYRLAPVGNYELSNEWGDSVLTDTQTEQMVQMQEVSQGVRSKLRYIMWRYGLTEEQAQEELDRINQERQSNNSLFGLGTGTGEE